MGFLGPPGPQNHFWDISDFFEILDFLTPQIPTLDLANGGVESTQVPNNPLPKTWLYRHLRRRARHLPPGGRYDMPEIRFFKKWHFQDSGKS